MTNGNGSAPEGTAVPPEESEAPAAAKISILGQYVKDLSFENPHSPNVVLAEGGQPQGEVSIQVRGRNLSADYHEVVLEIGIRAKKDDEIAYVVELTYGGVFELQGFDEELLPFAIWVECPRLLFPFARRVIADVVRDGGYPPLLLTPIDFLSLYQNRENAG